jgi:hypothetical protein
MTAQYPKADLNEIKCALSIFYRPGDVVELRALDFNGKPHAGYFDDLVLLANEAAKLSGNMMGVYTVLNPIDLRLLARSKNKVKVLKNLTGDSDVINRNWVMWDVDAHRPAGISSTNEEHEAAIITAKSIKPYLISLGFPPDSILICDSGNGAHVLAKSDLPNDLETRTLVDICIKAIRAKFEIPNKVVIDTTVGNASRIWKLYGTMACKGESTEDRPWRLTKMLEVPKNMVVTPKEAFEILATRSPEPALPPGKKKTYKNGGPSFDLETWMAQHGIEISKAEPYKGGTRYILKACVFNSNHDGSSAAIIKMANGAIVYKCQHDSCADNDWHKVRELKEPGYTGRKNIYCPNTDSELPEIIITNRPIKEITADGIKAIITQNDPPTLFTRGAQTVRVNIDENETPFIEIMTEPAMRGKLDRSASFIKLVKSKSKEDAEEYKAIPTVVPREVVQDLMTFPDFKLPALDSITEIPTIRSDGSILMRPGYDTKSKLFYAPDHDLLVPQIPDNPSSQEIRNAVNLILEVYYDFPYDSAASRTNMLAATATPIYRPMILGCTPLGIITKPQAGTGAGLSTEAMCMITTGRDALMMGAPRDEDEWEKKLLAVLKRGQTVITIDNVDGQLYSAQLARFITAKTVQGRILGQTQDLILPNRATWLVNGNNVSPAGDIPRRSYLVRMETQADRPWERKVIFKHDPIIPWVKANRGRIVAAYLTLAKAWIAAGKPLDDSLPRLGGFEDWVHVIGGIFRYAGIDGFLGNIENVYQTAENGTWETFIEAISSAFKCSEDFTVADIVDMITLAHNDDEIPETGRDLLNSLPDMVDRDPRKVSRSLGHALNTKNEVKWHNGLVIFKTNARRHGAVIWKIRNWKQESVNNDNEGEITPTNSPTVDSNGELGEIDLPTLSREKIVQDKNDAYLSEGIDIRNSYIHPVEPTPRYSPPESKRGELACLTPRKVAQTPNNGNTPEWREKVTTVWKSEGRPEVSLRPGESTPDLERFLQTDIATIDKHFMAINEWYLKQEATTGLDPNVTYWRNKAGITPIEITGLAGEKNGIRYFSVKDSITTIPEDNIINLHFDGGK